MQNGDYAMSMQHDRNTWSNPRNVLLQLTSVAFPEHCDGKFKNIFVKVIL